MLLKENSNKAEEKYLCEESAGYVWFWYEFPGLRRMHD